MVKVINILKKLLVNINESKSMPLHVRICLEATMRNLNRLSNELMSLKEKLMYVSKISMGLGIKHGKLNVSNLESLLGKFLNMLKGLEKSRNLNESIKIMVHEIVKKLEHDVSVLHVISKGNISLANMIDLLHEVMIDINSARSLVNIAITISLTIEHAKGKVNATIVCKNLTEVMENLNSLVKELRSLYKRLNISEAPIEEIELKINELYEKLNECKQLSNESAELKCLNDVLEELRTVISSLIANESKVFVVMSNSINEIVGNLRKHQKMIEKVGKGVLSTVERIVNEMNRISIMSNTSLRTIKALNATNLNTMIKLVKELQVKIHKLASLSKVLKALREYAMLINNAEKVLNELNSTIQRLPKQVPKEILKLMMEAKRIANEIIKYLSKASSMIERRDYIKATEAMDNAKYLIHLLKTCIEDVKEALEHLASMTSTSTAHSTITTHGTSRTVTSTASKTTSEHHHD